MAIMRERQGSGVMPGLATGIREIDEIGGGMRAGELWIICGETSGGKSVLSYQVALPAIKEGKPVLIFTLEMSSDEVFSRIISCWKRLSLASIMTPKGISKGDGLAIQEGARLLALSKLQICDEPNMSIDYVCAQSEQFAELEKPAMIIVDYIQLLDGGKTKGESREQELARIAKRLKQLAKKIGCPVVTPSQLNDDGKLRESRSIGHDADVVMKITEKGIAVNKYRNARRNDLLPLTLVGEFQRFETQYQ